MDNQPEKTLPAVSTREATCEHHGVYTERNIIGKIWSKCPTCATEAEAARDLREATEKKARAEAHRAQRMKVLLAESGLVGRQLRSTFDTYDARDPKQKAILADCQAYVAQFSREQPLPTTSLWLLGTPGTGKSHLGAAMVNHLITNHATPARMHSGQEIIRMLRSTWNRDKRAPTQEYVEHEDGSCHTETVYPVSEEALIHDIAHCTLLVLDEIGVGFGSNAEHVQLFEILDLRYKLEKPTVLLSNLSPTALKAALGDRVYDRLREGATVKACDWKSYRGEFSRMSKEAA